MWGGPATDGNTSVSDEFDITVTANPNAAANITDYWFRHDRENRVVVANGALVNVGGQNQIL